MAIGTGGGNDQGTSLEVQFGEASKIGKLVVETAIRRDAVRITEHKDTPNIPFLEPSKLSKKYIELLSMGGKVDEGAVKDAEAASLALSLEASLQIINAKTVKPSGVFIESTESLEDIKLLLDQSRKYVKSIGDRTPNVLSNVAIQVVKDNNVQDIPTDLIVWSNEIAEKAYQRIEKKINAINDDDNRL